MPKNNWGEQYSVKGSGVNKQGNSWESRDFGSSAKNQNTYTYKNQDGGRYYSNPNGARYYDNGHGGKAYTGPQGGGWTQQGDGPRNPK